MNKYTEGYWICSEAKHCHTCKHFRENLDPKVVMEHICVEPSYPEDWVKCEKYGVYSPTIIELKHCGCYNKLGDKMEEAIKIVDNVLDEHGIRPTPRRIGGVARWGFSCNGDNYLQDKVTDWVDRVLPIGMTFDVCRLYNENDDSDDVIILTVKEI